MSRVGSVVSETVQGSFLLGWLVFDFLGVDLRRAGEDDLPEDGDNDQGKQDFNRT